MSLSSSVECSVFSTSFLKNDEFLVILRPLNSAVILDPLTCLRYEVLYQSLYSSLFFFVCFTRTVYLPLLDLPLSRFVVDWHN